MSPPGRRNAPGKTESAPESLGDDFMLSYAGDPVRLRHGLSAIYVRDTDAQSIALRRLRRKRSLTEEQRAAYEEWLTEQRQDAS